MRWLLLLLLTVSVSVTTVAGECELFTVTAEDDYELCWGIDGEMVELNLTVATDGWIGFGISDPSTGSMLGADIVIVVNGTAIDYFTGHYYTAPDRDCVQDWVLVEHTVGNGVTRCSIKRRVDTSDPLDRPFLTTEPTQIIIAYASDGTAVVDNHLGNRLAASLSLMPGVVPSAPVGSDQIVLDITQSVETLNAHCHYFNISDIGVDQSAWVSGIELTTRDAITELDIFTCQTALEPPSTCNDPLFTQMGCELIYYWRGGDLIFSLPSGTGIPLSSVSQLVVKTIPSSSNINTNDSAAIVIRTAVTTDNIIPVGIMQIGNPLGTQDNVLINDNTIRLACSSDCTESLTSEVTVFGIIATGLGQVFLSRDGTTLIQIDYQSQHVSRFLATNLTLSPGDSFTVGCSDGSRVSRCGFLAFTYQRVIAQCSGSSEVICRNRSGALPADGVALSHQLQEFPPPPSTFGNYTATCIPRPVYAVRVIDTLPIFLFVLLFVGLFLYARCCRTAKSTPTDGNPPEEELSVLQ